MHTIRPKNHLAPSKLTTTSKSQNDELKAIQKRSLKRYFLLSLVLSAICHSLSFLLSTLLVFGRVTYILNIPFMNSVQILLLLCFTRFRYEHQLSKHRELRIWPKLKTTLVPSTSLNFLHFVDV